MDELRCPQCDQVMAQEVVEEITREMMLIEGSPEITIWPVTFRCRECNKFFQRCVTATLEVAISKIDPMPMAPP